VRFAEVTMEAALLRDELTATSLRRLYLEPLAGGGPRWLFLMRLLGA